MFSDDHCSDSALIVNSSLKMVHRHSVLMFLLTLADVLCFAWFIYSVSYVGVCVRREDLA
jgi:hypothetical protein